MSRSKYSEYADGRANAALWRKAVERAISGKRGQAFLRELLAALDAMPVKRLIAGELLTADGGVCAIGSVAVRRGVNVADVDPHDADEVGKVFGIACAMAREIEHVNDEIFGEDTPEERWVAVRDWVNSNLGAS